MKPRVPPSSPSGFGNDRARGREGRSGELRPFPKSQTRETEGTEASPCHTHTREDLGLGEMRTPFVSGGTQATRRPGKQQGKAGWKRTARKGSAGQGEQRMWYPGKVRGLRHPKDVAKEQMTSPIFLPGPRKQSGKCKRKSRGNPSLGQQPGRDTRAAGTGDGVGGSPFENRPGVRPSPHKAPPSQHLILKRGGACLNSPPHTAHPPHTPPAKTEVVMGGG